MIHRTIFLHRRPEYRQHGFLIVSWAINLLLAAAVQHADFGPRTRWMWVGVLYLPAPTLEINELFSNLAIRELAD